MSIQTALKKFLQERNLSQVQFAELTGVNPCGLSKFMNRENGESIAERIYPYLHGEMALNLPNGPIPPPEEVSHGNE